MSTEIAIHQYSLRIVRPSLVKARIETRMLFQRRRQGLHCGHTQSQLAALPCDPLAKLERFLELRDIGRVLWIDLRDLRLTRGHLLRRSTAERTQWRPHQVTPTDEIP